jgi:hypothetical protein
MHDRDSLFDLMRLINVVYRKLLKTLRGWIVLFLGEVNKRISRLKLIVMNVPPSAQIAVPGNTCVPHLMMSAERAQQLITSGVIT